MDAASNNRAGDDAADAADVLGRFARGDKLEAGETSVEALLRQAHLAPSTELDEQLMAAHTTTQKELQRERTCKQCGKKYVDCENVGRWRCAIHYAPWDITKERWACCMMTNRSADGCIRCDHTDGTRNLLDAVCVPLFLQPLICKPVAQAVVSLYDKRLDMGKIKRLATEEFATSTRYAEYAELRQVVLLRTNYLLVIDVLLERRRVCNAL